MSFYELAHIVTFRPLERPVDCEYRHSAFKASWGTTVSLLAKELRAHGANRAVLEMDVRERDLRMDGLPRADARPRTPGIVISFEATRVPGKPNLRYEVGAFNDWQDNVRAVALGLESLRAVDRYGVTKRGEQYAGWKQLPAGVGEDGNAERGRRLIENAGGDIKRALFLAHPDHNPDADGEDFRDIIAARDAA